MSHHDQPVRAADLNGGVIGAEVDDAIEAAFRKTALQLVSRPTSHQELVVIGTFLTFVDEDVPLGQEKASVLLGNRHVLLFISERSRLPIMIPVREANRLPSTFPDAVCQMLAAVDVPAEAIEHERQQMSEIAVGRTRSRSLLGSLNDFSMMARMHFVTRRTDPLERIARDLPRRLSFASAELRQNEAEIKLVAVDDFSRRERGVRRKVEVARQEFNVGLGHAVVDLLMTALPNRVVTDATSDQSRYIFKSLGFKQQPDTSNPCLLQLEP